jgi:choline dehydrogenase-like flavoprotein
MVDGKDVLSISYGISAEEKAYMKKELKFVKKSLLKLGLIPIKDVYMAEGTSAHYAGGVSSVEDMESPLRADKNGKIIGASKIFVADSSLWRALSAKPPTLTIMANANRIGEYVASLIK